MNNKTIMLIVAAILLFGICLYGNSREAAVENREYEVMRNEPGQGKTEYLYEIKVDEDRLDDILIEISERKYSKEECEEMYQTAFEIVKKKMLGENVDFSMIQTDLNLIDRVDGYPFDVEYVIYNPDKLDREGRITSDTRFNGKIVVILTYENFAKEEVIDITVIPGKEVKKRIYKNIILESIRDNQSETSKTVMLPQSIDEKEISYIVPEKKRDPLYLIFSVAASVALIIGAKKDERKKKEDRKEKIIREYPALLQKMSLYLASGMTIRNIWIAIYEEANKRKKKESPLYFEMGISVNELQSGISEAQVYKRFGERTEIPELVRFTSLLAQNLKKGSSKLKDLLDEETSKAFAERKRRAVKAGEQAGTKLLVPMMLLLIDVLIIIMVPAFWSI